MIADAPCAPWCDEEAVTACGPCSGIATGTLGDAITTASTWLWRATGKVYGSCPVTVLPVEHVNACAPACSGYVHLGSAWYFDRASDCWYGEPGRIARGTYPPEIRLGFANVTAVSEVRVDGAVLPSTSYRVDDHYWLVRLDGQTWPLNGPDDLVTTPPRLQVTLTHGIPVPPDGVAAAATLACELALACVGSGECRLPKRVSSISRQGVSMVVLDPMEFLDQGKFGIPEVDYFVTSANPHRLSRRAAVVSPDVGRTVRIPTSDASAATVW